MRHTVRRPAPRPSRPAALAARAARTVRAAGAARIARGARVARAGGAVLGADTGRALRAGWAWVRTAPGTYVWLLLLAATSVVVARMNPAGLDWFLARRSTNLDQLSSHPLRVLLVSAIWTEQAAFPFYFVVFHLFHVPAERWLGTRRWLTVALTAHVGATLISEGAVAWGVHAGRLPERMADTVDVGVSYALAGVQGVLTYRFAGRWRLVYGTGLLVFYLVPLFVSHTFTDLGHLCAVLIGLAFHRFTVGRPTWDPARIWRTRRNRSKPRRAPHQRDLKSPQATKRWPDGP
ncbi:rhomboid-like protein [Kitasatospora camelliae]|uniref:Rhomboid-like protein n=1 Tax=Kitasatospora camelliae TaxID=3156397 RepID=A0AAU8K256_9ACTN